MQCLQSSRIPHLARSLLSKQAVPRISHAAHSQRKPSIALSRTAQQRWASTFEPAKRSASRRNRGAPQIPAQEPAPRWTRRLHISRGLYFWVASLFGVGLGLYMTILYVDYKRSVARSQALDLAQNADVSSRWMDLSRDFDDEVNLSEKLMRLHKRRQKLCQQAHGNVLEVSGGTGRNMAFYDFSADRSPREMRVKSLVFNDQSEVMVYQAEKKYHLLQEAVPPVKRFQGPVKFVVGDGGDRRVIGRPPGGFDVIVQTMGICSISNPVAFLQRLGQLARQPGETSATANASKPAELSPSIKTTDYGSPDEPRPLKPDKGGKILLLEHGRSRFAFANKYLDTLAKQHAHRYGCWWNKDIEQVIKDSGLVVESVKRYNFGTTYEYVLRPAPPRVQGQAEKKP